MYQTRRDEKNLNLNDQTKIGFNLIVKSKNKGRVIGKDLNVETTIVVERNDEC